MIDPDTGLNYCKKHGWEQTKECVYCELESLRAAVKALVEADRRYDKVWFSYISTPEEMVSVRDKREQAIAAVERLEG